LLPLVVGTMLGMLFGASSLYLVLKVGITVSASIPVAVISITLFRVLSRLGLGHATILENNIVQTAGSAGESIAFGLGVTMPAILILGFDLELARITLVAVMGGLLGILMMIPLRRALIVHQHGRLKYPEGTACAAVLKASACAESRAVADDPGGADSGGSSAKTIFVGFGLGLFYKTAMVAFRAWKEIPEKVFGAPLRGGSVGAEVSPELLGVGYIIGPRIASITCAGGVLAYLVLIPAIRFFGEGMSGPLAPGTKPISEMSPNDIRGAYILYIGAGAVAAGGIISLFRSLPTIWHGFKEGMRDLSGSRDAAAATRTERDLPMSFVLAGIVALVVAITLSSTLHMNVLGAVLIVAFGFLFVTVSSRLTGEIGSTSNPISGMTVATLLLTCLIFLMLRWTGSSYYVTALSVGGIVCIAASNGGTTSQDLKTGFLVGATPKYQQIAILLGSLGSALILGPILLVLNDTGTVYVPAMSFEAVTNAPPRLDRARLSTLPELPPGIKAPSAGRFKLFANGESGGLAVAGLEPGDYLVNEEGTLTHRVRHNFPEELRADNLALAQRERVKGYQSAGDRTEYRVWHKTDEAGGPPGRYLVDDTGRAVYLVDPGINGTFNKRPDGSTVAKFLAPKATLMSYIIKGILNQQLPWALVLLGVMIAVVLEMSGVPSLAFAVGVYLPLSTSSPLFVGGLVRWLVDVYHRKKHAAANLTEEEMVAETDRSPGVMLASGYIAGGALAGIIIAFMAGVLVDFNVRVEEWAAASNPFYNGPNSDLLSILPFALLVALLYGVGREWFMGGTRASTP